MHTVTFDLLRGRACTYRYCDAFETSAGTWVRLGLGGYMKIKEVKFVQQRAEIAQEPPWSARNFAFVVPTCDMNSRREVQLGVADEIIARVHEKAAGIEYGNGHGA